MSDDTRQKIIESATNIRTYLTTVNDDLRNRMRGQLRTTGELHVTFMYTDIVLVNSMLDRCIAEAIYVAGMAVTIDEAQPQLPLENVDPYSERHDS